MTINTAKNRMVLIQEDNACLDGFDTNNDEERTSSPFDISKIRIDPKSCALEVLIKKIKDNEIDLAPAMWRFSDIWTDAIQSRFIESLILRIPIPTFYFDATNDKKWLVVDGRQRLASIRRFVVDQDLKLSGLEFLKTEYNGKGFTDLPRSFQRNIETSDVTMHLIKEGTPENVKFSLYRRINTAGLPLDAQEIRHTLNRGKVTVALEELVESDEFKSATDQEADHECVLRFFAFMITSPDTYDKSDFDGFLNTTMAAINKMPDDELDVLRGRFLRAMQNAKMLFDDDAFRKRYQKNDGRYPINRALFETWSVNLAKLSDAEMEKLHTQKDILQDKFIDLLKADHNFEASISQGTGAIAKVRYRFNAVRSLIHEVLEHSYCQGPQI